METVAPFKEVIDEIRDCGADALKYCYQCGKCDTVCPWNKVTTFSMRKLIREATFGLTEIETEEIWRCATCGKCVQQCPRDVQQIKNMMAVRRFATGYGVFPEAVKPMRAASSGLSGDGNPFGSDRAQRADWAKDLNVKKFTEGMEYLYFPGCYLCYDPRLKRVAQATARIFNKAGVDYGILGAEESCCGESIRKAGNEDLFKKLARDNIKSWINNGVKKIIVSSPHCLYTFAKEYPEFNVNFEIIHVSQLIAKLINEGKLEFTKKFNGVVTYHDPCYMGRHSDIYDEPREALNKIPGLELRELPENRDNAMCCGMGGGRIWMETVKEDRFVNLRLEQALDVGAEVLVTTCPYCVTNFEDARVVLNVDDKIQVKDLAEIIQELI